MTTKRRVKFVFGLLVFVSLLFVGFALFYQMFVNTFIYDSNLEAFTKALTSDQGRSILFSADSAVVIYVLMLAVSNVLWIIGGWYLVSRFSKKDDHVG
jgi:hypothetical protein